MISYPRKHIIRHDLLCIVVLALVGCGEGEPDLSDVGPSVPDASTLVDECTEAMPCALVPGAALTSAFLAEVGDEDPWTFDVPNAGDIVELVVVNDATFSAVQLEVALFGPDGSAIVNRRWPSTNGPQRVEIQHRAEVSGTYRAVIRDVGSDSSDRLNAYFVQLQLLTDEDLNEPNPSSSMATPLVLGTQVRGSIATQGDEDWFSVELTAGSLVEIAMSAPGEGEVRYRWSLFAPDGLTRIAESTEPAGADALWPVQVRAVGAQSGRFFILVEDDDGQNAEQGRLYGLTVRTLVEPDTQEGLNGNDEIARATVVTSGQMVTGYVASTSDADWYAIDVANASNANPQIITAEVAYGAASVVELQLALYEPDGTTLICAQRDGDLCEAVRFVRDGTLGPSQLRTAHVVTAPGRYLVSVRDLQDDEFDGSTPYTFRVETPVEPEAGETYLGDSRTAATVVPAVTATTGTTIDFGWVEGYLSYANDTDWYVFDIPDSVEPSAGQNGDWLVRIEIQMPSPTPVEMNAFFFGTNRSYRGVGQRCRNATPNDLDPCQWPDADNGLNIDFQTTLGQMSGDCFVVFREVTDVGPHYWRVSDLDRDDFDISPTGRYRFRMTITAGCPGDSACVGRFFNNGQDLCGRP